MRFHVCRPNWCEAAVEIDCEGRKPVPTGKNCLSHQSERLKSVIQARATIFAQLAAAHPRLVRRGTKARLI